MERRKEGALREDADSTALLPINSRDYPGNHSSVTSSTYIWQFSHVFDRIRLSES